MTRRPRKRTARATAPEPERDADKPSEPSVLQMLTGALGGALVLVALLVMRQERWTLTVLDAIFWGAAVALLAVRQVAMALAREQRPMGARLTHGLIVLGASIVIWAVAQAMGSAEPV